MNLLPVALNLQNRRVLIVGGGAVAARKAASCLECGAQVRVVAPELNEELRASNVHHLARGYQSGDIDGHALVFAATNSREVNAQVLNDARQANVLCSVADDAQESDFHGAASVRRGEICVGISTSGGSPALSKHLKARVEACIGPEYEQLLEMLRVRRDAMKETVAHQPQRALLWRKILEGETLELLRQNRRAEAEAALDALLHF